MRRALALALAAVLLATVAAACGKDESPLPGETTLTVDGTVVAAIVRTPTADPDPRTVLFLHGQSYTKRIWAERNILDRVSGAGWRTVAVDLPGYGDTPRRAEGPGDQAEFLAALVDELGGPERVVVVSPSRSGDWSLPYVTIHPDPPLAGFVPVAPVGIDGLVRPAGAPPVPTLSIWGSEDSTYSEARAQHLVDALGGEPTARTEVIDGASHAAYDDHPDEFSELLLDFLKTLAP
ncbi:MAG: alpha/beta hydrolase [Acidimicrobiales bacterium]